MTDLIVEFDYRKFSKRLKLAMRDKKMSCRMMQEATGVSYTTISRVCRQVFKPDVEAFVRLLHWLGDSSSEYTRRAK